MEGGRRNRDEQRGMPNRKPSRAGTLFLVLLITALTVPGILVVALDSLPNRLPWVEQHQRHD
jgi:hypothetical protein